MLGRASSPAWVRPAAVITLVIVAYHQSLLTLFQGLQLDTPVAHLALVPVISVLLVVIKRRPRNEPLIHDRQLDWIVGLPLVTAALAMNYILPDRLSTEYWVWRIDLLSLPFFAAGVIALVFGVRTLWRLRAAVLFLFLAWPWPYNQMLDRWLGEFTELTIKGLRVFLSALPLAKAVPGGDGSLFEVAYGTTPVRMSVASACSGANGLVGFFLVGLAFLQIIDGSRRRKIAWLVAGGFLVWVFNLVRIMIIFYAAKTWGETVAIDGFHPVIGLIVFNVAIVMMLVLLKPFGLKLRHNAFGARPTGLGAYRPSGRVALSLTLVAGLALGGLNTDLRSFDNVANSLGAPRLSGFASNRQAPDGWSVNEVQRIEWARRFFGRDSSWVRYAFSNTRPDGGTLRSSLPIYLDLIDTSSRASLSAYGIEACYKFHGYRISAKQSVDLGNGVVGGTLTWTNLDTDATWTTLYWHWPIKSSQGTRYERVTLLMNEQSGGVKAAAPEVRQNLSAKVDAEEGGERRDVAKSATGRETRDFLVAFARDLVNRRVAA